MYTDPKQNLIQVDHVLIEQFRRKGYRCEEIKEQNATVIIISHERENADFTSSLTESYKDLLKAN